MGETELVTANFLRIAAEDLAGARALAALGNFGEAIARLSRKSMAWGGYLSRSLS
jgi:hypothetical protein